MSAKEPMSVRVTRGWPGLVARVAAGLSLAIVLLSGILHATPIASFGQSQLQDSKKLASYGLGQTGKKMSVGPVATDAAVAPHQVADTSMQPATAGCILSNDCATTIQVPEAPSLVLVGSGLLAMAGVIRRRLLP
jgi:hypothetical protein